MDTKSTARLARLEQHLSAPTGAGAASATTAVDAAPLARNPVGWCLVNVDPDESLRPIKGSLKGKIMFVTGGSRGIGLEIAKMVGRHGGNVCIAAKTTEPQPTLPGTIYTAAKEVEQAGGKALPIKTDIRSEESINAAIAACVEKFGGIDILLNNASAISITGTMETSVKKFDLMHQVDARGTWITTRACLPHLLESAKRGRNPHVLTLSPPLDMSAKWFKNMGAYAYAKYGMSILTTLGMAAEFKDEGIAFNSLWPRTSVATSAVQNVLGGEAVVSNSRGPTVMSDAAEIILQSSSKECTGKYFIDDEVLMAEGVSADGLNRYNVTPGVKASDLAQDFFC